MEYEKETTLYYFFPFYYNRHTWNVLIYKFDEMLKNTFFKFVRYNVHNGRIGKKT